MLQLVFLTMHKTYSSSLTLFFPPLLLSFILSQTIWTCKMWKKHADEEERKDSSEGIWLVLIWKYYLSSSEINYWSELAVLREKEEHHRQPRWARSGRQICGHDHKKHTNPRPVELCSCPFIKEIKSLSLFLLGQNFMWSDCSSRI